MLMALLVLGALAWLALVIDCSRRPTFPPLFGSTAAAKLCWLLSFALCNPLILVLYAVFVVFQLGFRWQKTQSVLFAVSAVCTLALYFEWVGQHPAEPFVLTKTAQELPASGFSGTAKFSTLGTNGSLGSMVPGDPGARAQRRIRIVIDSDHPILVSLARRLAQRLITVATVDQVEFVPAGEVSAFAPRGPDLYLQLGGEDLPWLSAPVYGRAKCVVVARLADAPVLHQGGAGYHRRRFLASPKLNGKFEVDYQRYGFALGTGAYDDIAIAAAKWMGDAVESVLNDAAKAYGVLPDDPAMYVYEKPPVIDALAKRSATLLSTESGPFVTNRTQWQVRDGRPTQQVLDELKADFEAVGFRFQHRDQHWMQLERGDERIEVGRWPEPIDIKLGAKPPAWDAVDAPLRVTYVRNWSKQRLAEFAEEHVRGKAVDLGVAVLFESVLTGEDRAAMRDRILADPGASSLSAQAWVAVAEGAIKDEDLESAGRALMNAWTVALLEHATGNENKKLKSLSKQLGVAVPKPSLDLAEKLGYVVIRGAEEKTARVKVGETVRFVTQDGTGEFGTVELRVTRVTGGVVSVFRRLKKGGLTVHGTHRSPLRKDGSFQDMDFTGANNLTPHLRGKRVGDDAFDLMLKFRQPAKK